MLMRKRQWMTEEERKLFSAATTAYLRTGEYAEYTKMLRVTQLIGPSRVSSGVALAIYEEGNEAFELDWKRRVMLRAICWMFRKACKSTSLAYNEYLVCKWEFTKNVEYVAALHHREHCKSLPVKTREWCVMLVREVAQVVPEFRQAYLEELDGCEICGAVRKMNESPA